VFSLYVSYEHLFCAHGWLLAITVRFFLTSAARLTRLIIERVLQDKLEMGRGADDVFLLL
jgi:hypothetical protein